MASFDLAVPAKSPARATRSLSISSDRTSQTGYGGLHSPPLISSPEAAFIASSAASQIVTNDHDSRADTWLEQHGIEPSGETALVAPPALRLLNRFLDHLLFGFLAVSKSTSLTTLRPAVGEVLKTKLARHAIHGADQELHEYLGGGEDEDILAYHNGSETKGNWDLELVWKRTRLRCMVYSSLGDMEEEDEDFYTEQEQLDGAGSGQYGQGVVSPAVAIFLTSILEYMGEQILVVAGQSAYNRQRAKLEKEELEGTNNQWDIADRVVVEEFDMERVAMDRTLGRLWRGWKKRVRSPTASVCLPRSLSRDSLQAPTSAGGNDNFMEERRPSLAAILAEFEHAALIPLPITTHDIREIEIPGLAAQSDDEDDTIESDDEFVPSKRPMSLVYFDSDSGASEAYESMYPNIFNVKPRTRSTSMPSPAPARYKSHHETIDSGVEGLEETSPEPLEREMEIPEEQNMGASGLQVNSVGNIHAGQDNSIDEVSALATEAKEKVGTEEVSTGLMAGALAVGSAAVVGIVAAVKGEAPKMDIEYEENDVDEEPQIMTSSRISLGGRRSGSPDDALPSSTSSIRSPSIHSLRLIDVASPSRSRTGSIDASDYLNGRPIVSRSNSVHSPLEHIVRGGSPTSRGSVASPIARNSSALSTRQMRNNAEDSISEEKEAVYISTVTPDASEIAGAMQGVDFEPHPVTQSPVEKFYPNKPLSFVLATPSVRNSRGLTSHPVEDFNPARKHQASKTTSNDNTGPLAPLREMVEAALDTSDESSSAAPSNHSRTISEHGPYGHPPSSSEPHNYREQQRPARSHPANRNSPPRSIPEDVRKLEPISKLQRTLTSDSTSSGRSHKHKALRTSEDSVPNLSDDKGKNFEQLIRSDTTIQYTLTPQNMRSIDSPDSPRQVITPTIVSNSFDIRRPHTSRSRSSSYTKTGQSISHDQQSIKPSKLSKTLSRASSNAGKSRINTAAPRDPRVDRDSVNDFAHFIRSTGPANSEGLPKPLQHRGTNETLRNASSSMQRPSNTSVPRRAESSAGRSRLQARDPVVARGDSISDLIDFVRSGPQLDKENHRIPRTVAPFRSTMDSDQMAGAVGGKAVDATLPDRFSQPTSVNSSVNSTSALLSGPRKPVQHQPSFDEEPVMPQRKTRRVKDPYAIDFSDEEDEYEAFSKPKPIKEESLADFLRNVPPPKESTVTPIYEAPPAKNIRKKSSSASFRSRFSRKDSLPPTPPLPKTNGKESRASSSRGDAPRLPTHTPIATQYSTPIVYEPTRNNYVSQVDSARNGVAQKSYQPREAAHSTRTNDLANFLKSEPPSGSQTKPQPFIPSVQKEEGAFHRMFGRKKIQH